MTISAAIRPRHGYLTSVDHGWGATAREAYRALRPTGPKSSILVNGFTAWTLYWGATSRWSGELCIDSRLGSSRALYSGRARRRCVAGRLQQRRNLPGIQCQGEPAGPTQAHRRHDREGHGSAVADAGPAVQTGGRARGLEAGPLWPFCAVKNLSDLPLVRRSRAQGPRRRPSGPGRL